MEFINPEGLRIDGRRAEELRKINGEVGNLRKCSGSSSFEMGNTKVIVAVFGPREISKNISKKDVPTSKALISCEFAASNFSLGERRKRNKGDKRALEIEIIIEETFSNAIMTEQFPKSQIDIFIQVIQADGGLKSTTINATTLALIDAGIPMKDFVCSCSAGFLDSNAILDMNHVEELAEGPNVPVAIFGTNRGELLKSEKILTIQMDSRLSLDDFEKVLNLAIEGAKTVYSILQSIVKKHSEKVLKSRTLMEKQNEAEDLN